jgi:predicted lysophospholipase L1 biosynthesis ABC-type transport system permease subunit
MNADAPPAVIQCALQMPDILGYGDLGSGVAVRVVGDPDAIVPFLRQQVRALEPQWPIYNVERLDVRLGQTFAQPRFYTLTLTFFALLALSTAILGVYGVLSYAVERRRFEFGIRRALGAGPRDIVLLVVRRALLLAASGLILGLGGVALSARLMKALLFGVRPMDPASYLAAVAAIGAVVAAASWRPTSRALSIDPARALRID